MNWKTILAIAIALWICWEHQHWMQGATDEQTQDAKVSMALDREDSSP